MFQSTHHHVSHVKYFAGSTKIIADWFGTDKVCLFSDGANKLWRKYTKVLANLRHFLPTTFDVNQYFLKHPKFFFISYSARRFKLVCTHCFNIQRGARRSTEASSSHFVDLSNACTYYRKTHSWREGFTLSKKTFSSNSLAIALRKDPIDCIK